MRVDERPGRERRRPLPRERPTGVDVRSDFAALLRESFSQIPAARAEFDERELLETFCAYSLLAAVAMPLVLERVATSRRVELVGAGEPKQRRYVPVTGRPVASQPAAACRGVGERADKEN